MHKTLASGLFAFSLLAPSVIACGSSDGASKPTSSASETRSSAPAVSASAKVAAPTAKPSADPAEPASPDKWLLVSKITDLAVIELREGKPPAVQLEDTSDEAKTLEKKIAELVAKPGIALDMHEPGPGGKGRGASVSKLMKPGDRLYATALRLKLEEADYTAKEIPAFDDTPPTSIKQLDISREGEKVGSIDFRKTPPVVTVLSTKSDGMMLKSDWEDIQKKEKLLVRFHGPKGGVETLFKIESKPGAPDYPNAVRLHLIVNRWYDAQRKYVIDVVP